jgi:large subunit ribosomal protein L17
MVSSLFEHETIRTTIQKAKEVKPFAEKMITLGKNGSLAARRRVIAELCDRAIYVDEDGTNVRKGSVVHKLFSELGPRYLDRPGGYTRIIKLGKRRLGDNGEWCLLQLIGADEKMEKKSKVAKTKKAEPQAKAPAQKAVKEAVAEPAQETEEPKADAKEEAKD